MIPEPGSAITSAVEMLRGAYETSLAEVDRVEAEVERLQGESLAHRAEAERIASALDRLGHPVQEHDEETVDQQVDAQPRSVQSQVIELLEESDRDWSTPELLAEMKRRGALIEAKNPGNAVRAALSMGRKKARVVPTAPRRYRADKWAQAERWQEQLRAAEQDTLYVNAGELPPSFSTRVIGEDAPGS